MTAPLRSDFTTSTPTGWLVYHNGTGWRSVHVNGKTLIATLERKLQISPRLATPQRSFDGTMISGSQITLEGKWGPQVYRALWAVFHSAGATSLTLDPIEQAARAGRITNQTMTIAANFMLNAMGYAVPQVRIPSDAILPGYMQNLPGTIGGEITTDATAEELSAVGITPTGTGTGTSTGTGTGTGTGTAGTDTGSGNKTDSGAADDNGTGEKTPTDPGRLPTGLPNSLSRGQGISWGPILATLGAIAAFGLIAFSLRKPEDARANPRPRRAKYRVFVTLVPGMMGEQHQINDKAELDALISRSLAQNPYAPNFAHLHRQYGGRDAGEPTIGVDTLIAGDYTPSMYWRWRNNQWVRTR